MIFFLKIPVGKDPGNLQVHPCSALHPTQPMGSSVFSTSDLFVLLRGRESVQTAKPPSREEWSNLATRLKVGNVTGLQTRAGATYGRLRVRGTGWDLVTLAQPMPVRRDSRTRLWDQKQFSDERTVGAEFQSIINRVWMLRYTTSWLARPLSAPPLIQRDVGQMNTVNGCRME
jgi:hypothetical protein